MTVNFASIIKEYAIIVYHKIKWMHAMLSQSHTIHANTTCYDIYDVSPDNFEELYQNFCKKYLKDGAIIYINTQHSITHSLVLSLLMHIIRAIENKNKNKNNNKNNDTEKLHPITWHIDAKPELILLSQVYGVDTLIFNTGINHNHNHNGSNTISL